jgi:ABC-type nickel/cobalt efflux system permease component RcnA
MNAVAYIDHLLRNREQVITDLQDESKVSQNTTSCFIVFIALSALYGLIMGSQGMAHGNPEGWKFALASAVKLPFLFLLTLAICLPLLYILNVLIGPRAKFGVVLGLTLASITVTSIVLASCALIVLFFMMSTKSYPFMKMLNVGIFALAGGYGVWFLSKGIHELARSAAKEGGVVGSGASTIITWWLVAYGIVGTQMAWLMRPFVGDPTTHFAIFRAQESNFYVNVIETLGKLLTGN